MFGVLPEKKKRGLSGFVRPSNKDGPVILRGAGEREGESNSRWLINKRWQARKNSAASNRGDSLQNLANMPSAWLSKSVKTLSSLLRKDLRLGE
jgi:hypothetical protein